MRLNDEYQGKLIAAYRRSIFEKENIAISKIDDLISDENLKAIISLNNREMCDLINKRTYDVDYVRRLLVANINFYRFAYEKNSISLVGLRHCCECHGWRGHVASTT